MPAAYEDLFCQEARRRGWRVRATRNRISVGDVPYRKKNGDTGTCRIWVDTEDDRVTMKAPEGGRGAPHAATLVGVEGGRAHEADGGTVGNVLWTDSTGKCVISIKRDEGEYANAWHALVVYATRVAGAVGAEEREREEPVFRFEMEGEDDGEMQKWRDLARRQKVGIVGLGGVGLWILDLMCKAEVGAITIWDGDEIEGRNLARAPGWAGREAIGKNKAGYFGLRYRRMRTGMSIHRRHWCADDPGDSLDALDFVFLAVDDAETRATLCEVLEVKGVPFVDVGMGIERRGGRVRGSCQVFFSGEDSTRWRQGIPTIEGAGEDEYRALQLADLGALNAALAVGVWRRHIGQYVQGSKDWLVRYPIEDNELLKRTEQEPCDG